MILNVLTDPFFQFGATSIITIQSLTNWYIKRPFLHNSHQLPVRVLFGGMFWYCLNQYRLKRQMLARENANALILANELSQVFEAEGRLLESNEDKIKSYIKGINY